MNLNIYQSILLIILLGFSSSYAQVITDPLLPVHDDSVTVIFDATKGDGGLAGYTGDVYAHTGVITTQSNSPSDWKYVVSPWGSTDPKVKLENIGPDLYQLRYHVTDYYGVPPTDTICQMAFVFRNAGGSVTGRGPGGTDIFVDVAKPGKMALSFITPPSSITIVELNDSAIVLVGSALADTLRLLVNGTEVAKSTSNSLSYTFIGSLTGSSTVTAVAEGQSDTLQSQISIYVRGGSPPVAALPAGWRNGINYLNDSTVGLVLYAPMKPWVFVVGSFNDNQVTAENEMKQTPDGLRYWTELTSVGVGVEYWYRYLIGDSVGGFIGVADPLTEKILDPWSDDDIPEDTYPNLMPYPEGPNMGILSVFQTAQPEYQWQVTNFQPPARADIITYELLVRDFSNDDNFQAVLDSLGYLERMGVNAIHFMPVTEFENNDSWGYNPSFMLALDKYYGTRDKFKELVDSCHARGIAVILDIVLNHQFGQSPMTQMYWNSALNRPAANNPWFNEVPKHDFNVGYDMNHESQATKDFVNRVTRHWIEEYHVDGYRFDLSKGFTQKNTLGNVGLWGQYDSSRIAIWKTYADTMWAIDSDVWVILEHFANNNEEKELANYGMMIWGNSNDNYNEATMGYNTGGKSDFSWISYKKRGWDDPHVFGYMESHDEERLMYKNIKFGNSAGNYSTKDTTTALKRMELAAVFFFTIPGPKMLWQFDELGYDYTIDFNGRTGRKPVRWDYFQDPRRRRLYQVYSALADIKVNEPAFETDDFRLSVSGAMKRIWLDHADMDVCVLGNFDVVDGSIVPEFQQTGWWYEFITGDSIDVSDVNATIWLRAGEHRLYTTKRLSKPEVLPVSIGDSNDPIMGLISYPNPTDGQIWFSFELEEAADVSVQILDLYGRSLGFYDSGRLNAGTQEISLDLQALKLGSGLYLARIVAGDRAATVRILLR